MTRLRPLHVGRLRGPPGRADPSRARREEHARALRDGCELLREIDARAGGDDQRSLIALASYAARWSETLPPDPGRAGEERRFETQRIALPLTRRGLRAAVEADLATLATAARTRGKHRRAGVRATSTSGQVRRAIRRLVERIILERRTLPTDERVH